MKDPKATVRLSDKEFKALKVKTAQQSTTIQEVLYNAVKQFITTPKAKI